MNVLDLFSGIGGFSLGLERAGMRTVAFCEIDPFCRHVLAKHWPSVPVYDDIRTLTAARLAADGLWTLPMADPESGGDIGQGELSGKPFQPIGSRSSGLGTIDLICGGFPCQDISVAGKGAGIEGERSGLWSEYARIVGEVKPRWVIIENVSALLSGGDEYELPNDRCLCGWPHRWRGLHQHRTSQRAGVLSANRCGDGVEGASGAGSADGDIRRIDSSHATTLGEMGRGASLAAVRSSARSISESDPATSAFEETTSGACIGDAENDRLSAEEAEWLRFVDGESDEGRESNPRADDGIEPQGTAAQSIGGMVCEACGRDLDHAATRSGIATWMGRILRDLAQIGYSSEFHCIPASAVGAPHRRDRLWIVAHAAGEGWRSEGAAVPGEANGGRAFGVAGRASDVAYAASADASGIGAEPGRLSDRPADGGRDVADAGRQLLEGWGGEPAARSTHWLTEPDVGRVAHGVPQRVDRLRALGNAVVPQIPEIIGRAIMSVERDDYDGNDDFSKSIALAYEVIRERKAAGGKGWEPP